jgi:O-antigen/teichoic acid export membrane protein
MPTGDIKKGILTSYGVFAVDSLAGILFTPFLIRSLGQSEYGVYSLMGAFIASLTVLDFGFGNAITRYVAQYRAENRKDKESNFIAMCLVIYAIIAILALLVSAVIYFFLDDLFGSKLTVPELHTAKSIFLILMANITVSFFIGAYNAYIQGYEQYTVINGITFFRLLLRIAALSILLTLGFKALSVVVVDTLLNIGTGAVFWLYAKRKLAMKVKVLFFDRKLLREITSYSSFVFIGDLADMMFWRIGLLVLGAMAGAEAVAVYAVGMTLISYFQYISGVINGKLFPRVTQMVTRDADSRELTAFCSKVGRIQLMLLGGIVLGFQLYGSAFISLWVGDSYALSWWVGLILMTAMIVQTIQYPCVMILRAKRRDGLRTVLQLILMGIGTMLGLILVRGYGVIGMTIGLGLAIVLLNWIVVNIHYVKMFDYSVRQFAGQIGRLLPSMGLAYGCGLLIKLLPGNSWSTLLAQCGLFTAAYAGAIWFLGANEAEKAIAQNMNLKRLLKPAVKGLKKLWPQKI